MTGGKGYEMGGEIKKGPWKAEEDEVLMNHVKIYGPRDWSSIRSKGLLHRTGKSCRLRWVNKLRPNLKNGVKFSAEEERIVIELQAEFGNKWARIATFLHGRTDNDVKNFWSSRQKRLSRILQTPNAPCPPKSKKNNRRPLIIHNVPTLEAPKFCDLTDEESSSKKQSSSSSYVVHSPKPFKMVPLPELMINPNFCHYEQNLFDVDFSANIDKKPCQDHQQLSFPHVPPLQTEVLPPLALESQELMIRLGEPNFFEAFGNGSASDHVGNLQLTYALQYGTGTSCGVGGGKENGNPSTPDSFIDDFPMDMFDIEPLPSPSDW